MKTALFAICVLCASTALGQAGTSVSAQPQVYSFESHPEHASRQPLAQEQHLNGGELFTYAQGERPLWEVATLTHEVPLGDVARRFRQEHLAAKKAVKSLQK